MNRSTFAGNSGSFRIALGIVTGIPKSDPVSDPGSAEQDDPASAGSFQ